MVEFVVYWIVSGSKSYIGATHCVERRLRQHNREIKGGAKRTATDTPWKIQRVIRGFKTWQECLQFEYTFKHQCKAFGYSRSQRQRALAAALAQPRWALLSMA